MKVRSLAALAALSILALAKPALAANTFTMDFEGLTTAAPGGTGLAQVLDYYNGNSGPAYGVTFDTEALAINSQAAGGPGNFAEAKSGSSAVGALFGSFRLDLDTGLSLTGLEFFFDKQNGTGGGFQLLSNNAVVFSDAFQLSCSGPVGSDGYCGWVDYVLKESVLTDLGTNGTLVTGIRFLAEAGAVFDDIKLSTTGSVQPVPEPGSFALAMLGLALVSGLARRRDR